MINYHYCAMLLGTFIVTFVVCQLLHEWRVARSRREVERRVLCWLLGHTTTDHGPFWGGWSDRRCRRCNREQ
jgi:hypothetical protein